MSGQNNSAPVHCIQPLLNLSPPSCMFQDMDIFHLSSSALNWIEIGSHISHKRYSLFYFISISKHDKKKALQPSSVYSPAFFSVHTLKKAGEDNAPVKSERGGNKKLIYAVFCHGFLPTQPFITVHSSALGKYIKYPLKKANYSCEPSGLQ